MKRRGLGLGKGRGYYNIVPRDPFIHGLSAKGIPTMLVSKTDKNKRTVQMLKIPKRKLDKLDKIGMIEDLDPTFNKLDLSAKGRVCDECGAPLQEGDYEKAFSWSYTCPKCGFNYIHGMTELDAKKRKKMSELEKTFLSKEFEILTEQDIYAKGYVKSPSDYKKLKVGTKVRFHTRRGVITSQPKYVSGGNWGGYVAKIKWSDGEESEWNLHRYGLEFYGKLPPLPKITGKTKTVYGVIIPEGHKRVLGGDTIFTSKREAEQFVKRKEKDFLSADDYKHHKIKKFKVSESEFVPVLGDWVYERGQVHFARSQWQGD